MVELLSDADGAGADIEGFFAWETTPLDPDAGITRDVAVGRVVGLFAEAPSEARGVLLVVDASAVGREVNGRFAPAVLKTALGLRSVAAVFPGDDLVAPAEETVVLRAADFLFSSPDVMEAMSGSASEVVDLAASPLLAAEPGAGRVGGLFKLEPVVLVRNELVRGRDVVAEARAVLAAAAGRRAPAVAVPVPAVVRGRRGGAFSTLDADGVVEGAILRRAVDEGVAALFCCCTW